MTPQQVIYEDQEHQKWLHKMRQQYPKQMPCGHKGEISVRESRTLDAMNTRAIHEDDPESPVVRQPRMFATRLAVGFNMLGMENGR